MSSIWTIHPFVHIYTLFSAERRCFVEIMKKIIVTSAKGGIGKSTSALGIAVALADAGHRTLLADCDIGNRCLDLLLGAESEVLYDLGDAASGRCTPEEALLTPCGKENLRFCAAPIALDAPVEAYTDALIRLTEAADAEYVICDTAGTGAIVEAIARDFADGALVIATQQPASIRSAEHTAALMTQWGNLPCLLVISMFEENAAAKGIRAGLLEIIDKTHVRTVGVIPRDRALLLSQEAGQLPDPKGRAARALSNVAARLTGESIPLFRGIKGIKTGKVL